MKERLHKFIFILIGILSAGGLYALIVQRTGFGIPCLFRVITGWKCPGCGITTMCIALLKLELQTAYESNQALFLLSPIFLVWGIWKSVLYIKTGKGGNYKAETIVGVVILAVLFVFFLLRNFLM